VYSTTLVLIIWAFVIAVSYRILPTSLIPRSFAYIELDLLDLFPAGRAVFLWFDPEAGKRLEVLAGTHDSTLDCHSQVRLFRRHWHPP